MTPRRELPLADLISVAQRELEICNACRYCEGYCAVFPALERRTEFGLGDIQFIANLCHDCRACYYACPYAPPHEFDMNSPATLSAVRANTYEHYAGPAVVARLARKAVPASVGLTLAGLVIVLALVALFSDPARLLVAQLGPGAFYRVLPHLAMSVPALAVTAYGIVVLAVATVRFWRDTGGAVRDFADLPALIDAVNDALTLRFLRGGGDGCYYPGGKPSGTRRWLHSFVFYGFLLAFLSTAIAAFMDLVLGLAAPYPLLSAPVVTGTVGGVLMVVGCTALCVLKVQSDPVPAVRVMRSMDFAFLVMLDLASLTGLLLLALREWAGMGILLTIHLGVLAGLFVVLPYSKFAHFVYRFAALIRNKIEERSEGQAGDGGAAA